MRRVAGLNACTLAVGLAVIVLAGTVLGAAGLGAALGASGHTASAPPATSTAAHPTPAAQGQKATSILIGTVYTPGQTFPANVTFYTNITWGTISDTTTWAAVIVSGPVNTAVATGNDSIVAGNVTNFVNNGIPYANYTWTIFLNMATLGCTNTACTNLISGAWASMSITIWVKENGASAGGGLDANTWSWTNVMDGTAATAGFLSPATDLATGIATPYDVPMNMSVEFYLNVSYLVLSNSTLDVNLGAVFTGPTPFAANLSLNGTVNTTNLWGGSSSVISIGSAGNGWWSNITYSVVLNNGSFGKSWHTFVNDMGSGGTLVLTAYANADGTSAGSDNPGTQWAGSTTMTTGTTLASGGSFDTPSSYQGTPYEQTGWLWMSWVNPDYATAGNSTVGGYFILTDTDPSILAIYSLNDSVNTTNPSGVSLSVSSTGSGTTPLGVSWVNYTWSVWINSADVAGSTYGDLLSLSVFV
jgi:hypothetical protein